MNVTGVDQVVERFGALPDYVRHELRTALDTLGLQLQIYIQTQELQGQILNRRTGRLTAGILHQLTDDTGDSLTETVGVFGGVPYAYGLEYGNPAHVIVPVKANVLSFMVGSEHVFAQSVQHPGNPAFAYMRKGLEDNAALITSGLRKAVETALEQ